MPVEALPELPAYRDIVLAVAKALYQAQNPQRQRLPKGFEASFRLVLEGVASGSTLPVISRVFEDAAAPPSEPPLADLFDSARDLVERGIAAAASGLQLPDELGREVLARFNAFGRSLAEDESIVVAASSTATAPCRGSRWPRT